MNPSVSDTQGKAVLPPGDEYALRLTARRGRAARLARLHGVLSKSRRLVVGVVIVLAVLADKESVRTKLALLGVPAVLATFLVVGRNRVGRAWRRAERAAAFYEQRLACLADRWAGRGRPGQRFLDEDHPCALDLDLFGTGSLFERLCLACTRAGEDTLAGWLRSPAAPAEVHARQEAVAELRGRLDLREHLALLGADEPAARDDLAGLAAWASAGPVLGGR